MRKDEVTSDLNIRSPKDLWLLRIVAFVISVLLCLTVLGGKRIEIVKKVLIDYKYKKGLIIANQAPTELSVRMVGPQAFVRDFQDRTTTISVDLTSLRPGEDYTIPINEQMVEVPLGIKVLSMSQGTLPVRIDYFATKRVPIRAVFGEGLGDDIKVKSVTFTPSYVEIQGSRNRLISIDVIPTEPIRISRDQLRQEFEVKLSAADFPGTVIRESDRVVRAMVEIEAELSRKRFSNIPIEVRVGSGAAARKLDLKRFNIRVRPEFASFVLEGSATKIESMSQEDIQAWAEIPQAKSGTYRAKLGWSLSPDVRVVKRSTDWVDIVITQP